MADVTGTSYKPRPQEEEAWEDTSGVYDVDGNLLSVEDYANDDDGAVDKDDTWIDDFDNNEGLVEDQEIFNMDTGWSIEDFVADAPAAAVADHKVDLPCVFTKAAISLFHNLFICSLTCTVHDVIELFRKIEVEHCSQVGNFISQCSRQAQRLNVTKQYSVAWHAGKSRQAQCLNVTKQYGMQGKADKQDEAELGMAANSILQSIPPHVLKALEQQQAEANEVNAESKVSTCCLPKLTYMCKQKCVQKPSNMRVTAAMHRRSK